MSALLALLLTAVSLQPPPLPSEPGEAEGSAPAPAPGREADATDAGDEAREATPNAAQTETPPPPRSQRPNLPPGLHPIPFPLEQRRPSGDAPPTNAEGEAQPPPPPRRRSIVDLRDPFDRPPTRARPRDERARAAARLLMPDLKDPFSPSVRRVRSQTLDVHIPNDIRDPFRSRPRPDTPRPPCSRTTEDGTAVQAPGKAKGRPQAPPCPKPTIDLRDPFDR